MGTCAKSASILLSSSSGAAPVAPNTALEDNRALFVGIHADHRSQDIFFARTQSVGMNALEWDSRLKPLRSWGVIGLWGIAILMFVAASASLVR